MALGVNRHSVSVRWPAFGPLLAVKVLLMQGPLCTRSIGEQSDLCAPKWSLPPQIRKINVTEIWSEVKERWAKLGGGGGV